MARKPKVVLNLPGINEVMTSSGVQDLIDTTGQRIAATAGTGYVYRADPHRWVARGYVATDGAAGARDNAKNNTLLKSLGSKP